MRCRKWELGRFIGGIFIHGVCPFDLYSVSFLYVLYLIRPYEWLSHGFCNIYGYYGQISLLSAMVFFHGLCCPRPF